MAGGKRQHMERELPENLKNIIDCSWSHMKYDIVEILKSFFIFLAFPANVWKSHRFTRLFLVLCRHCSSLLHFSFHVRVHLGHGRNLQFRCSDLQCRKSPANANSRAFRVRSGLAYFCNRIPWRLLKPTCLISQNSAVRVHVWLPLFKSHWLIPWQLWKWLWGSIEFLG